MDTELDRWEVFYRNGIGQVRHGTDWSYKLAAEWLKDCERVEDWGCGTCWLKHLVKGEYYGIDYASPSANLIADLCDYHSLSADGVCLRHVLEYNTRWRVILANALASARKRLVIVLSDRRCEMFRSMAEVFTSASAMGFTYGVTESSDETIVFMERVNA